MRRYLIVDDNLQLAENLAEIIAAESDEALAVNGVAAAIEAVRKERFDALLTDMRMPLANGAELVHAVRQVDPELPACVMTAYTADDDLLTARREGLLAVFGKPVPIDQLIATLGSARRGGLVAIVEDDLALCDNLAEALRMSGFGTVTAASILETDRLGPLRPFVGLVDLRVPEGPDGEALRHFRAKFPDARVLAITAHPDLEQAANGEPVRRKPFDTAQLLAEIERLHAESRRGAR